jgi:hypothetical protein
MSGSTAKALVGYDAEVFFQTLQSGRDKVPALVGTVMCAADIRFKIAGTKKEIGPFVWKRTPEP